MSGLMDIIPTLDSLQYIFSPEYQGQLFLVERALEQARGLPRPTSVTSPESELDSKLLELIDSVALG